VNDQVANVVMAQLSHFESEDPEQDINVYINSPGGSVYAGISIYDTMRFIKCDVATTALAMAASMGCSCSRDEGQAQHAPEHANAVAPAERRGLGRQVSADIEIHARGLMRTKKRMNELRADHTGQPFEKIGRDTDRDYMLGAHEAVECGLIDRVMTLGRE
jgi:ATP-dependent Clp protease, protease subunit